MPGSNDNGLASSYSVQTNLQNPQQPDFNPTGAVAQSSNNLGGAFGVLQWLGNMAYNAYQADKSRKWQEQQMDKQRQWQIEDWNRQIAYNSPAAVMARMSSAGLNPDLLVGGNNSNAQMPGQGSVPSGSTAHPADGSGVTAAVQAQLMAEKTASEIAVNNAYAKDLEASALQRGADTGLKTEQTFSERFRRGIEKSMSDSQLRVDNATIVKMGKEGAMYWQQYLNLSQEYQFNSQYKADALDAAINEVKSRANLNAKQADFIRQQYDELVESWNDRLKVIKNDASMSDDEKKIKAEEAFLISYKNFQRHVINSYLFSSNDLISNYGRFCFGIDIFLDHLRIGMSLPR